MNMHKTFLRPFSRFGWRLAGRSGEGQGRGFLRVWHIVEAISEHVTPLEPIPHAPYNLLRIRVAPYKGRPITLPDGTNVQRGDRVITLHFNNPVVATVKQNDGIWGLMRGFSADLRALAAYTQTEAGADAKAVWSATLMYALAQRMGFTLRDQPLTIHARLERFYLHGLLVLYSQTGIKRLEQGTTARNAIKETWISRGELLRRYGPKSA